MPLFPPSPPSIPSTMDFKKTTIGFAKNSSTFYLFTPTPSEPPFAAGELENELGHG
jgi:hypothetical protein